MAGAKTVDEYVDGLGGWQQEVVAALREIVKGAAPAATESIRWAQPVYEDHGPFAYIKAFPRTVNLGFWRGAELVDPLGLLAGGGDRMRHVKLIGAWDVRRKAFQDLVKEAVALNRDRGDPTKRR